MSTLQLGLTTTFREKLEWLEAAEILTLRLRASREKRRVKGVASRGESSRKKLRPRGGKRKTVEQRISKATK